MLILFQPTKTIAVPPAGHSDPGPMRSLARALWSGLRQIAWGIDAMSSLRHGVDVPPDHGARNHGRRRDRYPRL